MFKTHIVYWLYIRHSIHTFRSWVTQYHNPLEKQKMPALKKSFNAYIGSRERKSFNARIGSRESRLMPVMVLECTSECMHLLLSLYSKESPNIFTYYHKMLALTLLSNDIRAFQVHPFYECFAIFLTSFFT